MTEKVADIGLEKRPMKVINLALFGGLALIFLGALFYIGQRFDTLYEIVQTIFFLGIGSTLTFFGMRSQMKTPGGSNTTAFLIFGLPCLFLGISSLSWQIWGYHGPMGRMLLDVVFVAIALAIYWLQGRNVAMFFTLLVGSMLYFQVFKVINPPPVDYESLMLYEQKYSSAYQTLGLGAIWAVLAFFFASTKREPLVNFMCSVAGLLAFSSMLWLSGWDNTPLNIWELAGLFASAILFFGSPYFGRSSVMWVGGLALLCNIIQITYERFAKDLEWSIVLMIVGAIITVMSALAFWMRNKYFAKK